MQVFDLIFVTTGGGPNFRTETMVNYIYSRAFSSDTHSWGRNFGGQDMISFAARKEEKNIQRTGSRMGGPNFRTETMVNYIYSRAFSSDTRLGYATAMSECLFGTVRSSRGNAVSQRRSPQTN